MHYAQRRSPGSNAIGIGLVALLHLGVGYALVQALGTMPITPAKAPLIATPIDEPKPKIEPPPPIQQPKIDVPKFDYAPPPIVIKEPPATDTPRIVTPVPPETHDLARVAPVERPVPSETRVGATPIAGPRPIYPKRYLDAGIEGWVDVQCDVDDMGSTSNCSMVDHQGPMGFVDEALDYVRASRYSPATRNGVPVVERAHRFHIVFKLSDK